MTSEEDRSAQDAPRSPLPAIELPKGGGAVRDIGEKFSVNAATGTGSFTVPFPLTAGRNGFTPLLNLAYDSGAGNGPFGFGWHHDTPSITRKTDKGLPQYDDAAESDIFILSGAEDLVPLLDGAGNRVRKTRAVHGVQYEIAWYRPRIDGLFARIERWVNQATGATHWRSITRENITTLFGLDDSSCIHDPNDGTKVFSYLASRTFDDRGNVTVYDYVGEDDRGIDTTAAHEANRTTTTRGVNRYLKSVRYANIEPYFPDWSPGGTDTPLPSDWYFKLVLDYGDHNAAAPTPTRDQAWPVRPDPFSRYRSAFEVRTYRRCARALFFNNFKSEKDVGGDCLVRSLDFQYSDQINPADPQNPVYTFLASVTQNGYRRNNNAYTQASLPPIEFEYSPTTLNSDVLTLDPQSGLNIPEGISGTYRFIDLDGEGLAGLLSDSDGGWTYKRNVSAANGVAQFEPAESLATLPARSTLENARLMSLSADGRLDVIALAEPDAGYFERTEERDWASLMRFQALPQIDWNDRNVTFADLTGDGLADVLLTEDGLFTLWPSTGATGFSAPTQVRTPWDEERGPKLVMNDGTQTIFLADMSGDGLSDLVRVRNGEIAYWPNLGYGRFGTKVTMDHSPRFCDEERYDPMRVHLADIDGSGTTDLIYDGPDGVTISFNQSGNAWSQPQTLAVFPSADPLSKLDVVDLLGSGTSCLAWSSPLPFAANSPLRYVDLMGGIKPHLLTTLRNNLGMETRVTYAPSTKFYVQDELAEQPWITRLHFPVQVVERVELFDWIGRTRFVSRYTYHHGYFDGIEREFRGFGRVDQLDTEEHRDDTAFPEGELTNWDDASFVPAVLTRKWFHTGAFVETGIVSRQYDSEYWPEVARPDDSVLPQDLSANDFREAYRALKGVTLRTEVFANDNSSNAGNPYSVVESAYTVVCLQPSGPNQHASFHAHDRETLSFYYERSAGDPRATHDVTLEFDPFGNDLRRVSIAYPRRAGYANPEPKLPVAFQNMLAYDQGRLYVTALQNTYTNDFADPQTSPDAHRTPLLAETIKAEITTPPPASPTTPFAFADLDTLWQSVWSGAHDVPYENLPASDVDGQGSLTTPTRRIMSRSRTLYRSNDLTALLSLGQLQSGARSGETYNLALTPSLVNAIFGASITNAVLTEGGYVQPGGDSNWWIPSGRVYLSAGDNDTPVQELANAQAHFFLGRRYVDQFGAISRVSYDGYDLLAITATDPVGNVTSSTNDYRVLKASMTTDPNENRTQAIFDTIGIVAGSAVMGKTTETLGDSLTGFVPDLTQAQILTYLADPISNGASLLGNATCRYINDYFGYYRTRTNPSPEPCSAASIERETHVSDLKQNQTTQIRNTLVYNDGFGQAIQKKSQTPGQWIGSAWKILNNKGKPVRTFEPFFTSTPVFEFAATTGVSTVNFYDPLGRIAARLHPDNTWEKTTFDPWRQELWDGNDTVKIGDPRKDADVGDYFTRLLGTAPGAFTSWHDLRIGGTYGVDAADKLAQQDAAKKTEAHAATQAVQHFDSLGRVCLAISDNGLGNRLAQRTAHDVDAHPLAIIDAAGHRAVEYCVRSGPSQYGLGYDLTGSLLFKNFADGGARRVIKNIAAKPLRCVDARSNAFRFLYDAARRPTHVYASIEAASEILSERIIYGEGQAPRNLCTRIFRHYDAAGMSQSEQYDFKGNLLDSSRRFTTAYAQSTDWTPIASLTDASQLDAATKTLLDQTEVFEANIRYDALNRPIQSTLPHSVAMHPNVIQPLYDEAGLVRQIDVWSQQGVAPASLLDPGTANLHAVTAMTYNARAQRLQATYGNQTTTTYTYDTQTFRLTNLTTNRPATFPSNQRIVQDLSYAYDPVGNVTRIRDDADTANVVFFKNQRVDPTADFTYDAIYRLVQATGREHLGQTGGNLGAPAQITNDDALRILLPQPGDGNAMGVYTESYTYDPVGNLQRMLHQVSSGSWTRSYAYNEASQIDASETCSRLSSSSLPGDPNAGPYSARYAYDTDGNSVSMPHLSSLTWDEHDRLQSTARQKVNSGVPETTYYNYSTAGTRIRKVTTRASASAQTASRKAQRLYLGGVEIYREYANNGTTVTLQRETLHAGDQAHQIALVETRTAGTDPAPAALTRYQYGNQLESALLELDDSANIITYEEYFPFGSTSYQAVRSQTDTPKRYRYAAKERDAENDLYYNGARYLAPWLGRWISCDPAGIVDGTALYTYVRNNPARMVDPNGTDGDDKTEAKKPDAKANLPEGSRGVTPTQLKWLKDVADARNAVAKDVSVISGLIATGPREMREDLRLSLLDFERGFLARDVQKYYNLVAEGPPPEPPPPSPNDKQEKPDQNKDKAAQTDAAQGGKTAEKKDDDDSVHLTLDVQNLFTYNQPGNGQRNFFSNDLSLNIVLKNLNLVPPTIKFGNDNHEISFGHEPQVGYTGSLHSKDPGDAAAGSTGPLRWHNQFSLQMEILNYTIKAFGRDYLEVQFSGVLQYDATTDQWQVQAAPGIEWHATKHLSVVGQVQWPWDLGTGKGAPPAIAGGLLLHTF